MELFKKLAEALGTELTATLVIKTTAGGKMTVCTNFTAKDGGVSDTLAPFTLKGSPEEMDNGFIDAILKPAEQFKGLVSNLEAFNKSLQQAEKSAKDAAAKKTTAKTPAANDFAKKAEEERKRREAEAKAKKENFDKAVAAAKDANAHGNYYAAEALLNLAATLTDDKKVKAELAKQVKTLAPQKDGFLCCDDEQSAAKALEEFKATMVKPEVPEPASEPAAEAEQAEEPVDIEIEDTDAETDKSDAEDDSASVEAA